MSSLQPKIDEKSWNALEYTHRYSMQLRQYKSTLSIVPGVSQCISKLSVPCNTTNFHSKRKLPAQKLEGHVMLMVSGKDVQIPQKLHFERPNFRDSTTNIKSSLWWHGNFKSWLAIECLNVKKKYGITTVSQLSLGQNHTCPSLYFLTKHTPQS